MADDSVVERGVLTAAAEAWDLAVRRAEVIRQLAGRRMVGLEARRRGIGNGGGGGGDLP
jgi:hypothetical protein